MARFVYVTYIRTTPEQLWQALTEPEFTRRYWAETWQESDWQVGSDWQIMMPGESGGTACDTGKVLEIDRPRRLVLSWRIDWEPEMRAEGYTTVTYELETEGQSVKLTLVQEIDRDESKVIDAMSEGWPHLLASLKSLLE